MDASDAPRAIVVIVKCGRRGGGYRRRHPAARMPSRSRAGASLLHSPHPGPLFPPSAAFPVATRDAGSHPIAVCFAHSTAPLSAAVERAARRPPLLE